MLMKEDDCRSRRGKEENWREGGKKFPSSIRDLVEIFLKSSTPDKSSPRL